jgi:hypothetical protein
VPRYKIQSGYYLTKPSKLEKITASYSPGDPFRDRQGIFLPRGIDIL